VEALDAAAAQLDEALRAVRALRQGVAVDPGRLEEVEARLEILARLRRKYGESAEAMLAFRETAAADLDRLVRHDEVVAEQERLQAQLQAELQAAAGELSEGRAAAARRLEVLVEREIRTLGMDQGCFGIALDRLPTASSRGSDRVEFRLAANPGEAPKALARVASGGELSRTMLALLAVLAAADGVPTVIFDEVDAGIEGNRRGGRRPAGRRGRVPPGPLRDAPGPDRGASPPPPARDQDRPGRAGARRRRASRAARPGWPRSRELWGARRGLGAPCARPARWGSRRAGDPRPGGGPARGSRIM
jgi:hypothetical protein